MFRFASELTASGAGWNRGVQGVDVAIVPLGCARRFLWLDLRVRFSAVAQAYHQFRPDDPAELLGWIAAGSGVPAGGRVADLGCRTGI